MINLYLKKMKTKAWREAHEETEIINNNLNLQIHLFANRRIFWFKLISFV